MVVPRSMAPSHRSKSLVSTLLDCRPPIRSEHTPNHSGNREMRLCLRSQTIDFTEFGAKVGKILLLAQSPDKSFDKLVGPIFAAVPVEVVFEPVMERAKLADLDLARDLRMSFAGDRIELGTENVANRVALK